MTTSQIYALTLALPVAFAATLAHFHAEDLPSAHGENLRKSALVILFDVCQLVVSLWRPQNFEKPVRKTQEITKRYIEHIEEVCTSHVTLGSFGDIGSAPFSG